MPILKASKKHTRQTPKRQAKNRGRKRVIKDVVKAFQQAIEKKDVKQARELLPKAYQALDRAAKMHTIHWKAASRKKSRLAKALKTMEGAKK